MAENKLNDIIGTSLAKIKELADGETVIGNPIETPNGTTVIPVSKVSMGFASGGIDYNGRKAKEGAHLPQNFGGGGGTGVSVTPIAFLIISSTGAVQLMPVNTAPDQSSTLDKITSLIERSPDILAKIKNVFTSGKKTKEKAETATDENGEETVAAQEETVENA